MLVNEFPPLPVGGAERQAERLSGYLAAQQWEVSVVTRHAPGLDETETLNGVRIVRPLTRGPGKMKTVSYVLGALGFLWRQRQQYQILHAHLAFGPAFAAVLAARLLGKRAIVKFGNSGPFGDVQTSLRTWRGRLRLAVFRRWADVIITLDDAMRSEALSAGFDAGRVLRIDNGIDAKSFYPTLPADDAKKMLGLSGKTVLLFVGRLAAQKSIPTVIAALAQARQDCPDLHLVLVGEGPQHEALQAQVRELHLTQSVTFAGLNDDVHPFFNAADIFVLPSQVEGISNALLEAMSAGLACVASAVGGNPEVLDHGQCGVLLPVGAVDAWARVIAELGNQPQRRKILGEAARQRILEHYDFSVIGARYEALYARLMGQGGAAV